jgi:beta-lactamase superfamily II metal-dependent hydrolase
MLVDAGPNEAGSAVVAYLQKEGVKRIDYLVATHPHADHIGGMDTVIQSFEIGKVYMPRVTTTTESFESVLRSIQAKGLKITPARAGMAVLEGDGLKVTFLAPCSSGYEDLNNWSAVLKVSYAATSFLLTGDAQAESEQEMLASGADLRADVLKVGHHGSYSSTSQAFLNAVSPKYAVISVGAGNDYGHPHQETLAKLAAAGIKVYRTDRDGTGIGKHDCAPGAERSRLRSFWSRRVLHRQQEQQEIPPAGLPVGAEDSPVQPGLF